MICYKDRTHCASDVEKHTCGREFTEDDARDAVAWWGSADYPVAFGKFCEVDTLETNLKNHDNPT